MPRPVDSPYDENKPWLEQARADAVSEQLVVFRRSIILTNDEIKALPTTPIAVIPPTETLNYEGTPTKLFVPLMAMVYPSVHNADYTNVDTGCIFGIDFGSDDSSTFSTHRVGPNVLNLPDITYFTVVATAPGGGGQTLAWANTLEDGLQDNAVVFFAFNQGSGNFTGGHADNTLKISVIYIEFTL